jgi:hypothetical protein
MMRHQIENSVNNATFKDISPMPAHPMKANSNPRDKP